MNSRTHGMFWVALQIILLIAWVVLLLAGERYIPNDTPRAAMDAGGLALILAGLLLAGLGVFALQQHLTPCRHRNRMQSLSPKGSSPRCGIRSTAG